MFAVHAAEQQYHHDIRTRDREQRILAAIRERSAAIAPTPVTRVPAAPVRPERAAWPRPIGLHARQESPAACAAA